MNCQEIQRYCIEYAGETLRADIQQHLTVCGDCRQAHEKALLVCKLISLKKYEQPDPGFEARSLARIRSAIHEMEEERQQGWSWASLFGPVPVPALRLAAVAAVFAVIGLSYVELRAPQAAAPANTV